MSQWYSRVPHQRRSWAKLRHLGNKELVETVIALLTTRTLSDAARKLGVNRNTIYNRKEKWHIDELIAEIPLQALQALQGSSLKAAMNMIEDLDSYRPKIRQDASKYILDKSLPQQPTTQVNIQNNLMPMDAFVLAMKQRKQAQTSASAQEQEGQQ